jgi:hypothetical protein
MRVHEVFQPDDQLDEGAREALAATAIFLAAVSTAHAPTSGERQPNYQTGTIQKAKLDDSPRFKKMLKAVTDKYNVDDDVAKEIVELVHKHEKADFPKAEDILAVIGIESSFRPHVKSALKRDPAVGLMQVRPGVWGIKPSQLKTLDQQIENGSDILAQYYAKLKKRPDSAISAYNVGLTNYMKRSEPDAAKRYLQKFKQERQRYS